MRSITPRLVRYVTIVKQKVIFLLRMIWETLYALLADMRQKTLSPLLRAVLFFRGWRMSSAQRIRCHLSCGVRLCLRRLCSALRNGLKLSAVPGCKAFWGVSEAQIFSDIHSVCRMVVHLLRFCRRRLEGAALQLSYVRCTYVVYSDVDGALPGNAGHFALGGTSKCARNAHLAGALAFHHLLSVHPQTGGLRHRQCRRRRRTVPLGRIALE